MSSYHPTLSSSRDLIPLRMFTDASVVFMSIHGSNISNMGGIVFNPSWLLFLPQAFVESSRNSRDVCRLIAQIMSFISSHVWSLAPEGWMVYQVESCGYRCNILTPCVECTDRFRQRSRYGVRGMSKVPLLHHRAQCIINFFFFFWPLMLCVLLGIVLSVFLVVDRMEILCIRVVAAEVFLHSHDHNTPLRWK